MHRICCRNFSKDLIFKEYAYKDFKVGGVFFINDININVFSFINCCELGFFLRTQRKRKLFPSLKLGMETWQRELHKKYDVFRRKKMR